MIKIIFSSLVLVSILLSQEVLAQTARKPSYYENLRQQNKRAPRQIQQENDINQVKSSDSSLTKIGSKKQFDSFARVYQVGTPFEIPHILFVIDIRNNNKIYFINTPKYQLHETFLEKKLLGKALTRNELNKNYYNSDRRFIFGTLSWQNNIKGYTYEFWEGDKITPKLLGIVQKQVNDHFFWPVKFKTNSTLHERTAQDAKVTYITQEELIKEQSFMVLNAGKASGRLVIVSSEEDLDGVAENDIILLKEIPIWLPPVAGIITEKPSTILSHVNLLSKGWKIPNIYLKNAEKILAPLVNKQVRLEVTSNNYVIEPDLNTVAVKNPPLKPLTNLPKPNTKDQTIRILSRLHRSDSIYCGAKAANLGEIKSKLKELMIPDGFCIPFAQYDQFMQVHKLSDRLAALERDSKFQKDRIYRKQKLAELREEIVSWSVDKKITDSWVKQWQNQLGGQGIFVRSSSNSEDLPNFSGAGLYTTIPNVKTAAALEFAVKQSWASIFNYEAYEARRVAKIPQDGVMMSAFVQIAVNSDASGVAITKDPFGDNSSGTSSYIVAKRGIGIRVVEGKKVAEQILYAHFSKAIQVLSQSEEDSALQLDEQGGVREIPLDTNRRVLTDELVIRLAEASERIRNIFGGVHQDIEWAVKDGKIIILQARPYVN